MNNGIPNMEKNLSYLVILRWAALAQVAVLYIFGANIGSLLIFLATVCYCLILTHYGKRVMDIIRNRPALLLLDLLIAGMLIWFTGGNSKSPYFIYAFTCLMVLPFFMDLGKSLLSTAGFSVLYTTGLFIDSRNIPDIVLHQDMDTLISNYVAFFLTTIFFGRPAFVIRNIEKTLRDTAVIKEHLIETDNLIAATSNPKSLSARELEVIELLMEGKTNTQIAEDLYISEKTVKNHLYCAYKKLGVASRSEVILHFRNTIHTDK